MSQLARGPNELLREAGAERRRGTDAGLRAAMRLYDEALVVAHDQPRAAASALAGHAKCCEAIGEPVLALADLKEALELPLPRAALPPLLVHRAELYLDNGTAELGVDDLRLAIRLSAGAKPGGAAYASHTRAKELLARAEEEDAPSSGAASRSSRARQQPRVQPQPEPEPEPAQHGTVVVEIGREIAAARGPLGISFGPTADRSALEVTAITPGSPVERGFPEVGPGCVLVAVKTIGQWIELEGKSPSQIWALLRQRMEQRPLSLEFRTTHDGMHWGAYANAWRRASRPTSTPRARSQRRSLSPSGGSRLQIVPHVQITDVLKSLRLHNQGEMTFSDFEKAHVAILGSESMYGVAEHFMELRDEDRSEMRANDVSWERVLRRGTDREFGVVLVDEFHSWVRGQAKNTAAEPGSLSPRQSTSQAWSPRSAKQEWSRSPNRASSPRADFAGAVVSPNVSRRTLQLMQDEHDTRSPHMSHRVVVRRQVGSMSPEYDEGSIGDTTVASDEVVTRVRPPVAVTEKHQRSFDKARKKAVARLSSSSVRVQVRQAVRYGQREVRSDSGGAQGCAGVQCIISNEGSSHYPTGLQRVRSKLLWVANAASPVRPRDFFVRIDGAQRGYFEPAGFVRAAQAAEVRVLDDFVQHSPRQRPRMGSYFNAKEPYRTPMDVSELRALFTALDSDGSGMVSTEQLTRFVFGVQKTAGRGRGFPGDRPPIWHYPLPHGRWETALHTLQLDMSGAAPALAIRWRPETSDPAHSGKKVPAGGGLAACCAAPTKHDPPSLAAVSAHGGDGASPAAVEVSVHVKLSEIRAVVFGATQPGHDPTATSSADLAAGGEDHWRCFSVFMDESRWDFFCTHDLDARACFLALQSELAPGRGRGGRQAATAAVSSWEDTERLWGRLLWHSARARLHALSAEMRRPHGSTLAQIVKHPPQPPIWQPIEKIKHKTLADSHLRQRSKKRRVGNEAGHADQVEWVDGAAFCGSTMLVGKRVDVEGHGRGVVVSFSVDAYKEVLHTLRFETAGGGLTDEMVTLKLEAHDPEGDSRSTRNDGIPFSVEVWRKALRQGGGLR